MLRSSLNGFCSPHPEGDGPINEKHRRQRNRSWCTRGLDTHRNPDWPYRNWGKAFRLEVHVIASAFSLSSFYMPIDSCPLFWCGTSCLSSLALNTGEVLASGPDHRDSAL